jgi:hypothetical protein
VAVTGHNDEKNGAVKYTTPKFEWKNTLTASDGEMADKAYDTIKEYLAGYFTKQSEEEVVIADAADVSAHISTPEPFGKGMKQEEMYHNDNKAEKDFYDDLPF